MQPEATRTIDVQNKVLCPGFIDVHVHSEVAILTGEASECRIRQGVTTDLLAPDGFAYSPLSPQRLEETRQYLAVFNGEPDLDLGWKSYTDYLDLFDGRVALNVVPQVGLNAVRAEAVGWDSRPATAAELDHMKALTREVMEAGATGLQTGLEYFPSAHATTEELVELCKVVVEYGGVYSSHIRGYGTRFEASANEVFHLAEKTGIPVHFSHLPGLPEFYAPLEAASERGIEVTFDAYPYMAGCSHIAYILPLWAQSGTPEQVIDRLTDRKARQRIRTEIHEFFEIRSTRLENAVLASVRCAEHYDLLGKSLGAICDEDSRDITDLICDLLVENRLQALAVYHWNDPPDEQTTKLKTAFTHPFHMVGSDAIYRTGLPHPRGRGTFPRVLGHLVREQGWLPLEDAIRRMTSFPAQRYGLDDRGVIQPGAAADVVVFDPDTVKDHATYEQGTLMSEGIDYVAVNGVLVLDDGAMCDTTPGRVLRRA
jgi:N-acyl-D-amino-acid deacylase